MIQASQEIQDRLNAIVDRNGGGRDSLICILQDVQSEFRYLPEAALRYIASRLQLPLIQVYGVATFFRAFSLKPRGKHLVTVCLGTACHVRGGQKVVEEAQRLLCIKAGETTPDMQFTLETVNCLGACALGPVLVIDGTYHGQMNPGGVKEVLFGKPAPAVKKEKPKKEIKTSEIEERIWQD